MLLCEWGSTWIKVHVAPMHFSTSMAHYPGWGRVACSWNGRSLHWTAGCSSTNTIVRRGSYESGGRWHRPPRSLRQGADTDVWNGWEPVGAPPPQLGCVVTLCAETVLQRKHCASISKMVALVCNGVRRSKGYFIQLFLSNWIRIFYWEKECWELKLLLLSIEVQVNLWPRLK